MIADFSAFGRPMAAATPLIVSVHGAQTVLLPLFYGKSGLFGPLWNRTQQMEIE